VLIKLSEDPKVHLRKLVEAFELSREQLRSRCRRDGRKCCPCRCAAPLTPARAFASDDDVEPEANAAQTAIDAVVLPASMHATWLLPMT
jgi:hypothetical protein